MVIGLGSLGANYGGSGGTRSYTANALYSFNLSTSASLTLGLLNMTAYNGGFDTLNFTVKRGATTLFSDNFTTLAAAQAYFTDQAKTLTGFTAGNNTVLLSYTLTASSAKGADISYLLSRPAGSALAAAPVAAAERQAALTENWAAAYQAMAALRAQAKATPAVTTGLQPNLGGSTLAGSGAPQAPQAATGGAASRPLASALRRVVDAVRTVVQP